MSIPDNDHVPDSSTTDRADTPEEVAASVIEAPPITHVDELDAARLDAATERAKGTAMAFRLMQAELAARPDFQACLKAAQEAETARVRIDAETKARYRLFPADTVDPQTGAITRAPVAAN